MRIPFQPVLQRPPRVRGVTTWLALGGLALATWAAASVQAAEARPARDAFLDALRSSCGKAFEGRIEVDRPTSPQPDPFADKRLVMHVRDCEQDVLRVPFHVGDDRSRTWVIRRTPEGLRLKHDHRHEDGTLDAVTMYGGDTGDAGSAQRQEFPVDAESVSMFEANSLTASVRNVWAIEIEPGRRFVYELARPDGRLFRVVFDLTRPVELPPPVWGHSAR